MLILYTAQALVKQNCLALEAGMKAKQKQLECAKGSQYNLC